MEKRRIGSLDVSVVGLGCNNFGGRIDEQRTAAVVGAALDVGINFFDTADVYGGTRSEELLGKALGSRRSSVIIATKFGVPLDDERRGGARPAYIQRAVEDSLRRLGTDWIDLYQLHRPDPETPIEDTLEALDALVRAGKVREIGSSNFSAAQIRVAEEAIRAGKARFVSVQNEYSLLQREPEREVLSDSKRLGIAFLPYFPLASGLLSGKYRPGSPAPIGARLSSQDTALSARFLTDRNQQTAAALGAYAASRGHTPLELAFSWLASRPAVASVIAGATSPEQVRANAAAVGFRLTGADLEEIDRLAPLPAR
ncbi:aldo/keto reductase [Sorangium sp. So ce726]|uniref:aldo/keto reductase n=1 Tax=Sorangium sp. So ce726 TaxID=3133319 RepID=UPI003F5D7B7D